MDGDMRSAGSPGMPRRGGAGVQSGVFPALVLFLAGALLRWDIYILGRISVGELLLVAVSLGYWGQLLRELPQTRTARVYLLLLGVWMLAILFSDFVNGTDRDLVLRGVARPLVILAMFVACLGLLRNNPRAFLWFFFGLLISAIGNLVFETDFRVSDRLERDTYGYAAFVYTPIVFAVTTILAFYVSRFGHSWPVLLFVAVFFLVSEQFSRTTAASFLVAAALFQGVVFFRESPWARRFTPGTVVMIGLVGLLVVYLSLRVYIGLAIDGTFGERLATKVFMQSKAPTGDPVANMFLSARYGLITSFLMIKDFPLFGSGSWPIEGPYVLKALEFLESQVSPVVYYEIAGRRGTGHSILFGNWANYGPFATLFWIYVIAQTVLLYREIILSGSRVYWLVAPYLVTFLFSIAFNNLNSLNRVLAALLPAVVIAVAVAARRPRSAWTKPHLSRRPHGPRVMDV